MISYITSSFQKLRSYLSRNGVINTFYAALERLLLRESYQYNPPSEELLQAQRQKNWAEPELISIVVPTYRTKETFLRELLQSVLEQTYPYFELILADASEDDCVEQMVRDVQDSRIRYFRLDQNAGIAKNTNQGIAQCKGTYIGLLDHDDVLTPDALWEMASQIEKRKAKGICPKLLYSDEDKCDESRTQYFEPHRKLDFNLDLLLTNNYICHFLVMESTLIKTCKLRAKFDGAQDYDLVLRAVSQLMSDTRQIVHVPKVLYHWRCHRDSTAQDPGSKSYAYEAGRRAVIEFMKASGWQRCRVEHDKHKGFYRPFYQPDILKVRSDVGAVGGKMVKWGRIEGGNYQKDGTVLYYHLPNRFSGPMNRAGICQNAYAVDIRKIKVRKECWSLFQQVTGVSYKENQKGYFDSRSLPKETDYKQISLLLGQALHIAGYLIVWDPQF